MNSVSNESATNPLDNEAFRGLLSRPLREIVNENERLRCSIREENKILKEWIISQEAFRSLANKFRLQLGITDEVARQMVEESLEKAVDSCRERGLIK